MLEGLGALAAGLLEAHKLGDVLNPMNDKVHSAVGAEYRRILWAPVPFFESAAFRFGPANIVLLDGHGVGPAEFEHANERCPQVIHAGCLRIVGIIREDFENATAQNLLATRHGGEQIGVADGDNSEVRRKDQIQAGSSLKQHPEIRLRGIHGTLSLS